MALEVRRLTETREGAGVLVALAGGPGQGASEFVDDFAGILAEGLVDRQLIVLDQRGTGHSGALSCPALDATAETLSLPALTTRAGRCAEQLGPRRRFYTTTEVVADLEALRAALGAERMALFGVSYGAYVAQRYARAYPARVDRLVLDSPVAQDQGGPFDASSYTAAARALRALCGRRCVDDVAALIRRLPLKGTAYDARGRPHPVRLDSAASLFDLFVSGDFSPSLRAALPAAIGAAVRGDAAPLLRIVGADSDTAQPDAADANAEAFSTALFFATTCAEKPQAWGGPDSGTAGRRQAREGALPALPAPFGRAAADSTQVGTAFCLAWPPTPATAPPAPGPIDTQALVLSGSADLRTPWEEARRTVAAIRDGTLVRVAGAGHAVVSQALPCVERALARFFADEAVGDPCDGQAAPAVALAPSAPRTLRVVPATGVRGRGARLAAAALTTLEDGVRTAAQFGPLSEPVRAGGLRGGRFCARPGEVAGDGRRTLRLVLTGDRYVPGVPVTGTATITRGRLSAASVTVDGRRLRLVRDRLVGRGVRASLRPERLRMPPLIVPAAVDATAC